MCAPNIYVTEHMNIAFKTLSKPFTCTLITWNLVAHTGYKPDDNPEVPGQTPRPTAKT